MQTKTSLLAFALSVASVVSAQSDSAAISSLSDALASLSTATQYIGSAVTNPAFISAISAATSTIPLSVISSEASAYGASLVTATAPVALPSYVHDLPSSVQGPISSYYAGLVSVIAPSGAASPAGSTNSTGDSTPSKSSSAGPSSSNSGTSSSASAKPSNGAVAQHPSAFMAAAAGALGFAALL